MPYYSQGSGLASTLTNWNTVAGGGGANPSALLVLDNNYLIIQAGHIIDYDIDMSSWTNGISGLLVTGGVSPGTLRCDSTTLAAGTYYLKVKNNTGIAGTLSTNRGRILANSDGDWAGTGELAFDRKFILASATTSSVNFIDANNLDLRLYCARPTLTSVRTYGTSATVSGINTSTDVFTTLAAHGYSNGWPVMFRSTGTLPTPLVADLPYYVYNVTSTTFTVSYTPNSAFKVNIVDAGTGTLQVYNGHQSTSTAVIKVLDDPTVDPQWTNTADHNYVCLIDEEYNNLDVQYNITMSAVSATSITLSANVDSVQYPNSRIYLCSRNISIRNVSTVGTRTIFYSSTYANKGGDYYDCEIAHRYNSQVGYGILYGANPTYINTFAGVVWGFSQDLGQIHHFKVTGIVLCAGYGLVDTKGWYTDYLNKGGYSASGCIFAGNNVAFATSAGWRCQDTIFRGNGNNNNSHISTTNCYLENCTFYGGQGISQGANGTTVFKDCTMNFTYRITHNTSQRGAVFLDCVFNSNTYTFGTGMGDRFVRCTVNNPEFAIHASITNTPWLMDECLLVNPYYETYGYLHKDRIDPQIVFSPLHYNPKSDASTTNWGYIRMYTPGGKTETEAYDVGTHGTPMETIPFVHKSTFQDSDAYCFAKFKPIFVPAGHMIKVRVNHKVSTTSNWIEAPKIVIAEDTEVPLVDNDWILAESADFSIADTNWHTTEVSYTAIRDNNCVIYMMGKGGNTGGTGTGVLYWYQDVIRDRAASPVRSGMISGRLC